MSWRAVARKDFEDAVRSRWVIGLSVLFVVLVAAAAYISRPSGGGTASSNAVLNSLVVRDALVTTLVPLIALVSAYGSVVGERSSGSLKLLLALPHSRADVVFGKVIGRAGAIAVPIAVGFLLPALALVVSPAIQFEAAAYVGFTLLVALLGVVFVAIAVGFSAATASTRLAVAGAVGLYFLFVPLWGAIRFPIQLYFGLSGGPSWLPVSGQQFVQFLTILNPTGSFKTISEAFLGGVLFSGSQARLHVAATMMLVAWLLVPPLLGLVRFEGEDL